MPNPLWYTENGFQPPANDRAAEYFKKELNGLPLSVGDKLRIKAGNRVIEYVVIKLLPEAESGSVLVNENTSINISVKKLKKDKEEKKPSARVSELYNAGMALLKSRGFTVELDETGDHVNHRILRPGAPPMVKGIKYPHTFNPLQDISTDNDFEAIEAVNDVSRVRGARRVAPKQDIGRAQDVHFPGH